jgi:hypothetical protein
MRYNACLSPLPITILSLIQEGLAFADGDFSEKLRILAQMLNPYEVWDVWENN